MSDNLIELVRERFGDAVIDSHDHAGDATLVVSRTAVLEVMGFLRDDARCRMEQLIDVTAVDFLGYPVDQRAAALPRFEVVYHLLSLSLRHRLRVKVALDADDLTVPSMVPLWQSANWGEREVYDMYGINFDDHPDLRRILLYPEFEGHPLRKDYHQRGYQPRLSMPGLTDYANDPTHR